MVTVLVYGDDLQEFEQTGAAYKLNCLMFAGSLVPSEKGSKLPYTCINKVLTEEDCVKQRGTFGKFCLEESKCVDVPGQCVTVIPKSVRKPVVQKFLERLFKRIEYLQNNVVDLEKYEHVQRGQISSQKSQLVQNGQDYQLVSSEIAKLGRPKGKGKRWLKRGLFRNK